MRPQPALILAIVLTGSGPVLATSSLEEFDRTILRELEALNPAAVELFVQANAARSAGQHREAADLYARVYEMAPAFHHALRRQCTEEMQLGDRATALPLCRAALEADPSAVNLATTAIVLISASPITTAEGSEALDLALRAAAAEPDGLFEQTALCQAAAATDNLGALKQGAGRLAIIAPDDLATHYFQFVVAAVEGRLEDAERALERARERGLPEDQYASLREALQSAQPWPSRLLPIGEAIGTAWLAGLLLLFLIGLGLSQVALRASRRPPAEAGGAARGLDAALRRLYAVVLWLCCGYYYLSIPVIVLAVVAAGGAVLYGFMVIGRMPLGIAGTVILLMVMTLWAIARSLILRNREEEPGHRLDLRENPAFAALLHDVASRVGTPPVDVVYVTPGAEVAVMERGGLMRQLSGRSQRCLILGVAVLSGLRAAPFRAVLAHEYGHLSNRDTAGGGFALAVRRSLVTMAGLLAGSGAARWYNPAWLFVNGFYRIFLRISHGATRLQEVLADRWAASTYGARAFESGLRHVIEQEIRFNAHADAVLREVIEQKKPLANLYAYTPGQTPPGEDIDKAIEEALVRPPSPYDSHPAPAQRFEDVRRVAAGSLHPEGDPDEEVWSLFSDRRGLELEMTARIRQSVQARYGVAIPADSAGAA
jgi:Zn-dependent protease with chaperone function